QTYAQQNKDKDVEKKAAAAYEAYLQAFEKGKERHTIELNRAGALYDATVYLPAAQQYEAVATLPEDKNKTRQQDIYNAVVAYYKAINQDTEKRQSDPERAGILNKLELLRAREGLKQLGAYFVKKYPGSDKIADVKFNVARMFYQQGEFARSVELFREFVKLYPTHKDVGIAGHLALDALLKLEKLDEMASLADAFAKDGRITNAEFKAEAGKLADAARKRKVEMTVIGTADAEFGKKMTAEWEKHKGTKEGEDYLYAAFSKYKAEGDFAQAMAFGDKLMGAYPQSRWAGEVVATLGNVAAQTADFERAAWMYEEYARRFPKDKNATDLLKNAAQMRFLLGEPDQASQDYTTLMQSGSADQRAFAGTKLLSIAAASGAMGSLASVANRLEGDSPSVTASFYAGLAAARQQDAREARQHFAMALRAQPQNDEEESLQARAQFEAARLVHLGFDGIQFHGAGGAEQVLKQKFAVLDDVEQAYLAAIRAGDSAWALASTYQLSRLYRDFAAFINKAPVPPGVSGEQYRQALSEQADPYVEKSKATLQACAQKAEQIKLLTP
ncbi:MAG TPA: outer membrane protein assembly factor BamD, partial [Myxococcota bacterium]|nr:outer membrane protein assembly factor BamD [Myxococcota bacterium]